MHVALYTFGIFRERAEHPSNDSFHALNDPIMELVDRAPGLIARAGYEDEGGDPPEWGPQVFPRWYVERGDEWAPSTLSIWADIEAIAAFVYSGLHCQAVRRGAEWFEKGPWPPMAMWWIAPGTRPDWPEAVRRHALLHDHGPTVEAFDLQHLFTSDGTRFRIDTGRLAEYRGLQPSA